MSKIQQKTHEKSMQILSSKKKAAKYLKTWIWEGLGLYLGRVWGGLGPLWASLGRLLAIFFMFKIEAFSSMGPRWGPRGLLDDFGSMLGRIWEDFGRIWEGLERNLGAFLAF